MQPVVEKDKVIRFKENKIVRDLLDFASSRGMSLNQIAIGEYSQEDREQFVQLIGYSVCGFHELDYVSDLTADMASVRAKKDKSERGRLSRYWLLARRGKKTKMSEKETIKISAEENTEVETICGCGKPAAGTIDLKRTEKDGKVEEHHIEACHECIEGFIAYTELVLDRQKRSYTKKITYENDTTIDIQESNMLM